MSAHGRALSALVTLSAMALAPPVRAGSKCGTESCEALQKQPPHYALLQIRGKLSVSKELDEDRPLHGLPAAGLADISVFHDRSKNLTDFEEDYLLDDNNPLDGISAAEGASAAPSSSASSSNADGSSSNADGSSSDADGSSSEAGSSSAVAKSDGSEPTAHGGAEDASAASGSGCCEEDKAECLACKEGSSVEVYCTLHADVQGCEVIFDCGAGVEHWQAGWSDLKKIWCCQNKKVGCSSSDSTPAPASSTPTPASSYDFDEDLIHDGIVSNASAPTSNVSSLNATRRRCVTRLDPRASAMGYTTSLPGTPCVFGTDDRDEGSHCIMDDGRYGSFGWCWTSSKQDSWGSCSQSCPLFGQAKVLGDYIQSLEKKLADAMTTTTTTTTANTTATETTTTTATAATTTVTAKATNATGKASNGTNSSSGKNKQASNGTNSSKNSSSSGKGPGGDQASNGTNSSKNSSSSGKGPGGDQAPAGKGPGKDQGKDAGKGPGGDKGKDAASGPSKKGGLDLSTGTHGH